MNSIGNILMDMKNALKLNGVLQEEPQPTESCPICHDTGTVFYTEDGIVKAKECPVCMTKIKSNRWMKKSGIPESEYQRYTLESFKEDTPTAAKMKKMAMDFLQDSYATGIAFLGKSGNGKTHICTGICQKLNKEHYYWQYRSKIQEIKNVMYNDSPKYEMLINQAKNVPCLYIDDFFKGAVMPNGMLSQQDLQVMFDIIDARYINRRVTIISSEYTVQDLIRLDEATAGRIIEMASPYVCNINGENRRLHNFIS